jgi:hypothetical protein
MNKTASYEGATFVRTLNYDNTGYWSWIDTSTVADGVYWFFTKVYDSVGNVSWSSNMVREDIGNQTLVPVVSMAQQTATSYIQTGLPLNVGAFASVSNPDGGTDLILKVEFYKDSDLDASAACDSMPPGGGSNCYNGSIGAYTANLDTTNWGKGVHAIYAKAYDSQDASVTMKSAPIYVMNCAFGAASRGAKGGLWLALGLLAAAGARRRARRAAN